MNIVDERKSFFFHFPISPPFKFLSYYNVNYRLYVQTKQLFTFRENVHVKERRKDAIASDQIEMKIGYLVDTRLAGSAACTLTGLNSQVFIYYSVSIS